MGKVVTVMNMKGGVGKTTAALHIGSCLARYQIANKARSVLLIDYDPQFNLSQAMLSAADYFALEKQRKTCLSILQDDAASLDPFKISVPGNHQPPAPATLVHRVATWKHTKLDLLPSTMDLMYLALGDSSTKAQVYDERFSKFIAACRAEYDAVIIDCHPAGSLLTRTSLTNSDHVLIPVAPQPYALRGIGLMKRFIESGRVGGKGPTPHIFFNNVPRTGLSTEEVQVRADATLAPLCLAETMKRYKAFSEPMGGQGYVWSSRKAYSTEALSNLYAILGELAVRCAL